MARRRTVNFARINRRRQRSLLEERTFAEDMSALAEAKNTEASYNDRTFRAADMRVEGADFLTGILGYEQDDTVRAFDSASFSWRKGEQTEMTGASQQNLVPFAVDLRDHERWVAFATTNRIRRRAFVNGFAATLNAAVAELGMLPSEWEVDLVTGKATVREWIARHDDIVLLVRTVRRTNPGRDLDEVRQELEELAAKDVRSRYRGMGPGGLNLAGTDAGESILEGTDTGDTDLELKTRGGDRFITTDAPDSTEIDEFGADLDRGTDAVLRALQEYVQERAV